MKKCRLLTEPGHRRRHGIFCALMQRQEGKGRPPDDFISTSRDRTLQGSRQRLFPEPGDVRQKFDAPSDWEGKTVLLDIDGAYMNAEVFLNEEKIGYNPYGYTPFFSDMTDYLKPCTQNELKVITQCRQPNSRWYSGGGLYREVNVWVGDAYYIHTRATFITTPDVSPIKAQVLCPDRNNQCLGKEANVQLKTDHM